MESTNLFNKNEISVKINDKSSKNYKNSKNVKDRKNDKNSLAINDDNNNVNENLQNNFIKKSRQEPKMKKLLNFYNLNGINSKIACHGRPTSKDIKYMKLIYGVNYVLTIQYPKEQPEFIKKICDENEIEWSLFELHGASLDYFNKNDTVNLIVNNLVEFCEIIKNQNYTVFIHCAAGVHRTGTIVYSLLRIFGETPESALKVLEYIRLETRKEVGDARIQYTEKSIIPSVIKKLEENKFFNSSNELNILNNKLQKI